MYLNRDNIQNHATYIHFSRDTTQDRLIHFGTGISNQLLLEVPIGHIGIHDTIVVTLGLDKSYMNTASYAANLRISLSDGTNNNLFYIFDHDYSHRYPCRPVSGYYDSDAWARVNPITQAPSMFKLTFVPFFNFATCETGQEGGYINTARFYSSVQLDITKYLRLQVLRLSSNDQVYIHYLKVEKF